MLTVNRLTGLVVLKARPVFKLPVWLTVHKFCYYHRCNFHFIILHTKAKKHLPWYSALSRPTVNTCRSVGRRSVVSTSLDINVPRRRDACNLDVGS